MKHRSLISFSIFVLLIANKDGVVNSFTPSNNVLSNTVRSNQKQKQNNIERHIVFSTKLTRSNINSQVTLRSSLNSEDKSRRTIRTGVTGTSTNTITSTKEKINVFLFRMSLISITVLYSLNQLPMDALTNIEHSNNAVFGWQIFTAALIIPNYQGSIHKTFNGGNHDNYNDGYGYDYDGTRLDGTDDNVHEEDMGNDSLFGIQNNAFPIIPILSSVTILFLLVSSTITSGNISHISNLEVIAASISSSSNLDQLLLPGILFGTIWASREVSYFRILTILLVSTSITGLNASIDISDEILSGVLAFCLLVLSALEVFELENDLRTFFGGNNQE
jgi:hypothetical protein